ncbi:MAG: hypothetical protein IJS81_01325 [Selenomonadaceae bacterium]|nr:hypothetical protein [Selenomonadaceae bacterium]
MAKFLLPKTIRLLTRLQLRTASSFMLATKKAQKFLLKTARLKLLTIPAKVLLCQVAAMVTRIIQ